MEDSKTYHKSEFTVKPQKHGRGRQEWSVSYYGQSYFITKDRSKYKALVQGIIIRSNTLMGLSKAIKNQVEELTLTYAKQMYANCVPAQYMNAERTKKLTEAEDVLTALGVMDGDNFHKDLPPALLEKIYKHV